MHTILTHDQQVLVDAVAEYARKGLMQRDHEWDRTETSCCTHLDDYYGMGLMGLRAPEEFGGLGCGMLPYAHIIRELAYGSPSVSVTVSVHNMVCGIVDQYAHAGTRREMLPRLVSPGNLAAFAISEPNAGSDPAGATVKAEPTSGGWRLSGAKMWVTNGVTGRWFVVLCRTGKSGTKKDLSMLLLDAQQPGVSRSPIKGKMGIRASETAEMALDGAFVPTEHMLGGPGDGLRIALTALNGGRIGIASQANGISAACVDLMTEYAKQREQFGRPIADFQAIRWMIADSVTELAAAQCLTDKAAAMLDAGQTYTREAAMAKLFASETANRIAYRAVQIHGGNGYCGEFRVEQLYRDARITTIYEGTSEIQRLVIAREALDKR